MPIRTNKEAPCFQGSAAGLERYLEDIEMLCEDRQRSGDAELIRWAVYYTDEKSSEIWSTARDTLSDPKTWDAFKKVIANNYPEAQPDRRHTIAALYAISDRFSAQTVASETTLAEYYREFSGTAQYLIRKRRMTRREASIMYMSAFPSELRPEITTRLTIKHPDVHPDDGYDLKDMSSAAQFIITSRSALALLAATTPLVPTLPTPPTPPPPSLPMPAPLAPSPPIQPAAFSSKAKDLEDRRLTLPVTLAVKDLIAISPAVQKDLRLLVSAADTEPLPSTTFPPNTAPARPLNGCIFCGDAGHRTHWCHIKEEYTRQGKIKIVDGRIQFLDGNEPNAPQYRHFGQWFKERIDVWLLRYSQPTAPRPFVSSNFLEAPIHAGTYTAEPVHTEELHTVHTTPPTHIHTTTIPSQPSLLNTTPSEPSMPSDSPTATIRDTAETSDIFNTTDDPAANALFSDTPETLGGLIAEVFITSEPLCAPTAATLRPDSADSADSADIPTAAPTACTIKESETRRTHPPLPFYFQPPSDPSDLTRRSVLKVPRRCNEPISATLEPSSESLRSLPKHAEPRLDPGG